MHVSFASFLMKPMTVFRACVWLIALTCMLCCFFFRTIYTNYPFFILCLPYFLIFILHHIEPRNTTEDSSAVLPSKIKRKCNAQFSTAANASGSSKPNDDRDHYESDLEDYDTDSPAEPLPLYQQRENYFT